MDVVIQSDDLGTDVFDAFRIALLSPRHRRHTNSARFFGVAGDAQTRHVAQALAAFWRCDVAFVRPGLRCTDVRVLVMDMDSTVITFESIDELARLAGQGAPVAAITAAAMRGEIADYAESLRQRVALLAGTDEAVIERMRAQGLRLSGGARRLLEESHRLGWTSLLASGGFTVFAEALGRDLGFDEICANELVIRDGRLTGEALGPEQNDGKIIDAAGKARMLQQLCDRLGCAADRALVVGDGANDLEMMSVAGLSVAYRAKPVVKERASFALDYSALDGVLEFFADRW